MTSVTTGTGTPLEQRLKARAREMGFDPVGITSAVRRGVRAGGLSSSSGTIM